MNTPSKKDFDAWREFAAKDYAADLADAFFYSSLNKDKTLDSIVAVLYKAKTERVSMMLADAKTFAVYRWLHEHPSFKKAVSLVFPVYDPEKPANPRKKSEWVAQNSVVPRIERGQDPRQVMSACLTTKMEHTWTGEVASALDRYLHEDVAPIIQAASEYQRCVQELQQHATRLSGFRNVLKEFVYLPLVKMRTNPSSNLDEWKHFAQHIDLARKSTRKSEQIFVYRMAKVNRRWVSKFKADAIAELMQLGCFRHPYDERHIIRLCNALKSARRPRTPAGADAGRPRDQQAQSPDS